MVWIDFYMRFFYFKTTINNFPLKIETRWAKSMGKHILETRNVSDVCMCDLFILDKKLKK